MSAVPHLPDRHHHEGPVFSALSLTCLKPHLLQGETALVPTPCRANPPAPEHLGSSSLDSFQKNLLVPATSLLVLGGPRLDDTSNWVMPVKEGWTLHLLYYLCNNMSHWSSLGHRWWQDLLPDRILPLAGLSVPRAGLWISPSTSVRLLLTHCPRLVSLGCTALSSRESTRHSNVWCQLQTPWMCPLHITNKDMGDPCSSPLVTSLQINLIPLSAALQASSPNWLPIHLVVHPYRL